MKKKCQKPKSDHQEFFFFDKNHQAESLSKTLLFTCQVFANGRQFWHRRHQFPSPDFEAWNQPETH